MGTYRISAVACLATGLLLSLTASSALAQSQHRQPQIPTDPYLALQAQYAQQRFATEQEVGPRYAAVPPQDDFQMLRRLPRNRNVGYARTFQDDSMSDVPDFNSFADPPAPDSVREQIQNGNGSNQRMSPRQPRETLPEPPAPATRLPETRQPQSLQLNQPLRNGNLLEIVPPGLESSMMQTYEPNRFPPLGPQPQHFQSYPVQDFPSYPQQLGQQQLGQSQSVPGLPNPQTLNLESVDPSSPRETRDTHANCGCSQCRLRCAAPRFYFSSFGGVTDLKNLVSTNNETFFTDNGTGFGVAIGQSHPSNLRSELEFSYRDNDLLGFESNNIRQNVSGDLTSYSGLGNVYWEFMNFPRQCFKPYVGAGIGFTYVDSNLSAANGQNLIAPGGGRDSSLAYQFMAGINYKAYRNMDLFLEYRLFRADTFSIETLPGFGNGVYDYKTDNLFAGLRWKF